VPLKLVGDSKYVEGLQSEPSTSPVLFASLLPPLVAQELTGESCLSVLSQLYLLSGKFSV
jgi:hypothetical protein